MEGGVLSLPKPSQMEAWLVPLVLEGKLCVLLLDDDDDGDDDGLLCPSASPGSPQMRLFAMVWSDEDGRWRTEITSSFYMLLSGVVQPDKHTFPVSVLRLFCTDASGGRNRVCPDLLCFSLHFLLGFFYYYYFKENCVYSRSCF